MGRNFVIGCVLPFSFLLCVQNQLPQIIIEESSVIYHIKAPAVVIRTTLKTSNKISQCREKPVENFKNQKTAEKCEKIYETFFFEFFSAFPVIFQQKLFFNFANLL